MDQEEQNTDGITAHLIKPKTFMGDQNKEYSV